MYKLECFSSLFLVLLLIGSCSEPIRINEIHGEYMDHNAVLIKINLELSGASSAYVKYWEKKSPDTLSTMVSKNKFNHSFTLPFLQSDREYYYAIIYKQGGGDVSSDIYSFKTGILPSGLPEFDLVIGDKTIFDGYVMLRRMTSPGAQLMLNSKGEIVWYQLSDSVLFRPFFITSNSSYLALKATDEILEMSIYGDTLLNLKKGINDFNKELHHEIYRNEENHIVALTKEEGVFDCTNYGGIKDEIIVGDGILVMDSVGNEIWSWNIFKALELSVSEELYNARKDWSHANALKQDVDGNYLISFRNFNQIWKVDATDGSIMWKLGKGGDFELADENYFIGQHAVHINPRGEMMIFDNTVKATNSSRALGFTLNEQEMTAEASLIVDLPDSLYSFKQGSAFLIDKNKLLFCSSMSNKIAITNLQGEILWQVNSDQSFYRAEYLSRELEE